MWIVLLCQIALVLGIRNIKLIESFLSMSFRVFRAQNAYIYEESSPNIIFISIDIVAYFMEVGPLFHKVSSWSSILVDFANIFPIFFLDEASLMEIMGVDSLPILTLVYPFTLDSSSVWEKITGLRCCHCGELYRWNFGPASILFCLLGTPFP